MVGLIGGNAGMGGQGPVAGDEPTRDPTQARGGKGCGQIAQVIGVKVRIPPAHQIEIPLKSPVHHRPLSHQPGAKAEGGAKLLERIKRSDGLGDRGGRQGQIGILRGQNAARGAVCHHIGQSARQFGRLDQAVQRAVLTRFGPPLGARDNGWRLGPCRPRHRRHASHEPAQQHPPPDHSCQDPCPVCIFSPARPSIRPAPGWRWRRPHSSAC